MPPDQTTRASGPDTLRVVSRPHTDIRSFAPSGYVEGIYSIINPQIGTTRGGKPFLAGRARRYGTRNTSTMFTGTYLKTRGTKVQFLCKDAPISMGAWPERPPINSTPAAI